MLCLYNPRSKRRADHLQKACDIVMRHQSPDTVCGTVRNIGREGQQSQVMTLRELRDAPVDMFTTVFIGNSATRRRGRSYGDAPGLREQKAMKRLLLFGGTTEGRQLAQELAGLWDVTVCVATEYGRELLPAPGPGLHVQAGRLTEEAHGAPHGPGGL